LIHTSAIVSPHARLGKNVQVGPFSIIYDNVEIGDNTIIGSHCEIGYPTDLAQGKPLIIGPDSLIRSHSVFYEGSTFGARLVTGHRVTVRELTRAGINLQIGTLSDFQGHIEIGDYVRTHSNVHIGHNTRIRNFVWIFPYVVFTNDPHPPSDTCIGADIGDYAAVATMSVILPGVKVGEHSLVAAHACVTKDVEPHTVVGGNPAKFLCSTNKIKRRGSSNEAAYPWTRHFHRGYPEEVVQEWLADPFLSGQRQGD